MVSTVKRRDWTMRLIRPLAHAANFRKIWGRNTLSGYGRSHTLSTRAKRQSYTMSIEKSERLEGKREPVKCPIRSRHYCGMTKYYHFWFGKVRIETLKRNTCDENFKRSSSIHESLWHARILLSLTCTLDIRKRSLVTLEYIIRENRKTSVQVNTEPIKIIVGNSPVLRACYKPDFKAVCQLIEGSQVSCQQRPKRVDLFREFRMPYRARDTEHHVDYLTSLGMNPWEDAGFFFGRLNHNLKDINNCLFSDADGLQIFGSRVVACTSISRAPTYEIEHVPRCFRKLISARIPDLLDNHEFTQVIVTSWSRNIFGIFDADVLSLRFHEGLFSIMYTDMPPTQCEVECQARQTNHSVFRGDVVDVKLHFTLETQRVWSIQIFWRVRRSRDTVNHPRTKCSARCILGRYHSRR